MNWYDIPIKRPVATAMLFCAIMLLGIVGWMKIPVELFPAVEGDELYINFSRPNSEPEVVERELLMPLEAKVSGLQGVKESWGQVNGSSGSLRVSFEPGTDVKIRQLDLQRLAIELRKDHPPGTYIGVNAQSTAIFSRFVMIIQVTGGMDINALRNIVDDRIQSRIESVTGVSSIWLSGAPEEITVRVDPDKCASVGVTPGSVTEALVRSVHRLRYLGGIEDSSKRFPVMLDGRPKGSHELNELRITPDRPVLIRHVADVAKGTGRIDMMARFNGKQSVALYVFKEQGSNLVKLGKDLRSRVEVLRDEFKPYGIDFLITDDGAEFVEDQLQWLKKLALTGFIIALVILFLFIRRPRAVAVVALAVPVSLLAAMAMLYLGGYTINVFTLVGLAVGVGMLVDNSIVVYESIQRRLERGIDPDTAAGQGVKITIRAILASTVTTAIVFLPVFLMVENSMVQGFLKIFSAAILLPLVASLIVAIGLVPLLSRKLAAPAALSQLEKVKKRRELYAGVPYPDKWRELFSGLLKNSLRNPAVWLAFIAGAVLITLIVALPWVAVNSLNQETKEADQVRLTVDVPSGDSIESIGKDMLALEEAALAIDGVKYVQSMVREGESSLVIKFVDKDDRPESLTAGGVREKIRDAAKKLKGFRIESENSSGDGNSGQGNALASLLGQGESEIVLSGPDSYQLKSIAESIKERLSNVSEIGTNGVKLSAKSGQEEIHVVPDSLNLNSLGLTADQVLPLLGLLSRQGNEMRVRMSMDNGKEIPITVRNQETVTSQLNRRIEELKLTTSAGVIPLGLVSTARKMPPPPMIQHHNGRRELSVFYRFTRDVPETGPARETLDEEINSLIKSVHVPAGYIIEPPDNGETTSWFERVRMPMLLLLFAVLAVTFESLTMPILVLLALPLVAIGSIWALVFAGMPLDTMAMIGIVVLLGLTVNPAILLVDRMQQRVLNNSWSAGAAALAAVRERCRPVLMTTCTTIAGLWPLAIPTGVENEIWPPFAVIVMGGLATSSLLILLVIPIGFVFLSRLDKIFGRFGPWVTISWMALTASVMTPLIIYDHITTMTWQFITTVLVAAVFFGIFLLLFRKTELPEPDSDMNIKVKFLHKIYGRPGPVGRAWKAGEHFAEKVLSRGGIPFLRSDAIQPIITMSALLIGAVYLATSLDTTWWRLVFSFTSAIILSMIFIQFRRLRGKFDKLGRTLPGGIEHLLAFLVPWIVFSLIGFYYYYVPHALDNRPRLTLFALVLIAAVIIFIQQGRKTAKDMSAGKIDERIDMGFFYRVKNLWRRVNRRLFSLDLPNVEVDALKNIHFNAESGMIGILGPNGAGKTTLLRALAGILVPTTGVIELGGVPLKKIRRHLANWIGYLPQDFGLSNNLTGREYLEYYALLYKIDVKNGIKERVDYLLNEVGLWEQADKKIGDYSGGMRQRVAVARTLLRLPPVIIVDEPTVGLDPRERIRFRNLLAKLGKTRIVLFSTHVVEDVAVACDRVIVLSGGRKVFDDKPNLLAHEAEGKVWELTVREGEGDNFPEDAIVVDRVPEEDGLYNIRVLCTEIPSHGAKTASPNLQDGYLQLVGTRKSRPASV
ncbi:efflux RND transporter permease subunit [Thermodesulfobacteriota bacterium]